MDTAAGAPAYLVAVFFVIKYFVISFFVITYFICCRVSEYSVSECSRTEYSVFEYSVSGGSDPVRIVSICIETGQTGIMAGHCAEITHF